MIVIIISRVEARADFDGRDRACRTEYRIAAAYPEERRRAPHYIHTCIHSTRILLFILPTCVYVLSIPSKMHTKNAVLEIFFVFAGSINSMTENETTRHLDNSSRVRYRHRSRMPRIADLPNTLSSIESVPLPLPLYGYH